MNILEPIACAIGEAFAYVIGRLVGRTFHLEERKAQQIGENVVIAIVFGAAVVVTLLYS